MEEKEMKLKREKAPNSQPFPCGGKGAAPRSSILHLNLRPSPLKPLSL